MRFGTSLQAIAYALSCGDDACSFLTSWLRRDADAIKEAWPGYNKIMPEPEAIPAGTQHAEVDRLAVTLGLQVDDLCDGLLDRGLAIIPLERDRGDGRKAHYGEGEQPWDTCLEKGWAAQGAAFSILRYLRRSKQPGRDLEAAKVYHRWLFELARIDKGDLPLEKPAAGALGVYRELVRGTLTIDECERLGVPAMNMLY